MVRTACIRQSIFTPYTPLSTLVGSDRNMTALRNIARQGNGGFMNLQQGTNAAIGANAYVEGNRAAGSSWGDGGAIYSTDSVSLVIADNFTAVGNVAAGSGGALYAITLSKSVLGQRALFVRNSATLTGGAMYLGSDSTLEAADNLSVINNTASLTGGGLNAVSRSSFQIGYETFYA